MIRVAAAGINRADVFQRLGMYDPPPGATDILGLECTGVVVEIGESVSDLAVGDEVSPSCPVVGMRTMSPSRVVRLRPHLPA